MFIKIHLKKNSCCILFRLALVIRWNRLVQIKTAAAAVMPQINSMQVSAAFQVIKRLARIWLAKMHQMPHTHKIRSPPVRHQLTTQTHSIATKIAKNLSWMRVVLMRLEVVAKIIQKIALGAVYHAIKRTHHHWVRCVKVAFIIGGTKAVWSSIYFFFPSKSIIIVMIISFCSQMHHTHPPKTKKKSFVNVAITQSCYL